MKEMTRRAAIDAIQVPEQVWYDTLRNSDDGSFGQLDENSQLEDRRRSYLQRKVLTPRQDEIRRDMILS